MLPFGSPFSNNAFYAGGMGSQQMPLPGSMPSNSNMFPPIPQLHLQGMDQSGMPQMQPSAIQGLAPITYGNNLSQMMPYQGPSYGSLPQTQGFGMQPQFGMHPQTQGFGMQPQFGMQQGANPMLTNPLAFMQQTPQMQGFGGYNPFAPQQMGAFPNASAATRQGAINSNPFTVNMSVPGLGAAPAQPAAAPAAAPVGQDGANVAGASGGGGGEGGGVGGGGSDAGGGDASGGGSDEGGGDGASP